MKKKKKTKKPVIGVTLTVGNYFRIEKVSGDANRTGHGRDAAKQDCVPCIQ